MLCKNITNIQSCACGQTLQKDYTGRAYLQKLVLTFNQCYIRYKFKHAAIYRTSAYLFFSMLLVLLHPLHRYAS